MNKLRIAIVAFLLLVLVGVWAYLFWNTRAVDTARQNQVLARAKLLKQIDAEWNVDVLKSQIELNKNYDPLVRPVGQMVAIAAQLRADAPAADAADAAEAADLRGALQGLGAAVDRKAAIVDRFKSQNAVIKNSLRYLPTAHAEIQDLLHRERGAPAPAAWKSSSLELAVGELVNQVLKYNASPEPEAAASARSAAAQLRDAAPAYPPAIREALDNLLRHAEIVLRQRLLQVELLAQVAQVPIGARIDAVGAAFSARFDRELAAQAHFQQLLIYHSGVTLLAIVAAIGFVVQRSRSEVRRMAVVVEDTKAALRQSEAQLVHAEKMSMMGEIVGGIVHEINTPLGYLRSGLQSAKDNLKSVVEPYAATTGRLLTLLRQPGPDRAQAQRLLNELHVMQDRLAELDLLRETDALLDDGIAGVAQINETVVNLLNFSRLDRTRMTLAKVESGIDSTLKLASHMLKNKKVLRSYGETGHIYCDLSQLNQVFLNIVKNAAQATPLEGGRVIIRTSMRDQGTVRIDVSDNGAGIDPAILPKIFDAFFTTKKAGSGTGLGLSICKRIVDSHGGEIKVESKVGTGTTFSLLLPVAPPASLIQEQAAAGNANGVSADNADYEIA